MIQIATTQNNSKELPMRFTNISLAAVALALVVASVGCSPKSEEQVVADQVTPEAAVAPAVVTPAPDLEMPDITVEQALGSTAAYTKMLGKLEVDFSKDGVASACAEAQAEREEFLNFVSVEPKTANVQFTLIDQKLCVRNLVSERDYELVVSVGAPFGAAGSKPLITQEPIRRAFSVKDLRASLSFADDGFVLAKGSSKGVPLFSTNIDSVALELIRVPERAMGQFLNSMDDGFDALSPYELRSLLNNSGTPVWKGTVSVAGTRNIRAEKALPLADVLARQPEGLFLLVAADASDEDAALPSRVEQADVGEWYRKLKTQWILSTNLGVSVAKFTKGMTVSVRALDTAQPVRYAKVDLVTKANDIVFSGDTNSDGVVVLPETAVKGKLANRPSHLVVRAQNDYSLLVLNHAALDLSALNTGGRNLDTALDAYVFTDRGIYRPRETVHVTGLVRDRAAALPNKAGVSLVVYRPNKSVYETVKPALSSSASFSYDLRLPSDAPRGSWRVDVKSEQDGGTVGFVEIDVQDFVPEKLKVTVDSATEPLELGSQVVFPVTAAFLYGAPGSELGVESDAAVRPLTGEDLRAQGGSGFEFGDVLQPFVANTLLTRAETTDAKGQAKVIAQTRNVSFPSLAGFGVAVSPLEASVIVGVQEPGGRTTKGDGRRTLLANKPIIGVKNEQGGWVDTQASAEFSVKLWDKRLEAQPVAALRWQLQRVEWNWYYDRSNGRWRSDRVVRPNIIAKGDMTSTRGDPTVGSIKLPMLDWGRYALTVIDEANSTYNRQTFYSGWSSNANSSEPDFVEVKAKSQKFSPGEAVTVGVKAPYDGLGRISVWTDREVYAENVTLRKGDNSFDIKSQAAWFPGAYVVVNAFRPIKSAEENVLSAERYMPIRSMGLIYLEADAGRRLQVQLPKDTVLLPRTKQTLQVTVPQLAGKTGYVVVQAVDDGILQLTKFKTPAPESHFFAKRRLDTDFFDDYGKLLRGDGAVGEIRTGSDQAQAGAGGQSLPVVPTKSVVIYSGVVALDITGTARLNLDVPDFNGSLRTMATVWSNDSFGSASTQWTVRDPLVADLILPRYVAPGDTTVATLLLANTTDKAVSVTSNVQPSGSLSLVSGASDTIELGAGERKQLAVSMEAVSQGVGKVKISVATSAGFEHTKEWSIYSRYAGKGNTLQGGLTEIKPGSSNMVSLNLSNLQSLGRSGYITVNDDRNFSSADALRTLTEYPWTCSEQTVSKAGPSMHAYKADASYVESVVRGSQRQSAKDWLQSNVDRIISRQADDGSIGLWRAGDGNVDPQLSAYLVDFLVTAELSGFKLPADSVSQAYAWSYRLTDDSDLSDEHKMYVLSELVKAISPHTQRAVRLARALADRADTADVLTQSNLAVALNRFGDKQRSEQLLASIETSFATTRISTPGYYDSDVSRLSKLAENLFVLKSSRANQAWEAAIKEAAKYKYSWWSSVHEDGSLLRAKVAQVSSNPVVVSVYGETYTSKLGGLTIPLLQQSLRGARANVVIESQSAANLYASIGVQAPPKPGAVLAESGADLLIKRDIYDYNTGSYIGDFSKANVNDRFVVLLRGSRRGSSDYMQVMFKDPVQAGFQIESVITPDMRDESFLWLPALSSMDVTESNDDAFFAAKLGSLGPRDDLRVAYVIRATTPGSYLATQAVIEDMYSPATSATSNGAPIRVFPSR